MKNFYSLTTKIFTSEVDSNKNVRLDKLVEKFQDITILHSYEMGVDRDRMVSNSNAFWVLTKFKFVCSTLPRENDLVSIKTWPKKAGIVKLNREFTITRDNIDIVQATSEWVLLDMQTGKIRPTKTLSYPFDMEHIEEGSGAGNFNKFSYDFLDNDYVYTYNVVTTDIDANRHTNNITYLRCIINSFDYEDFLSIKFNEFEIHYLNQSFFKDNIQIYKKQIDKEIYIKGQCNGNDIFLSRITLK